MTGDTKLKTLYELGQGLLLLQDAEQIGARVLEIADEVLHLRDSAFLLVDEGTQELRAAAERGDPGLGAALRLPPDGERSVTLAAAARGQPVYVPDVGKETRDVDSGIAGASELAVPVACEGRVKGVINVRSRGLDAFAPDDVQLLSILASQAGLALHNAQLHAQHLHRAEELRAINRIARRMMATLGLRDTLDIIIDTVADLVPCVLAEISLWDEERRTLTLEALRCEQEQASPIEESYAPGEGYTSWLVRDREPLLVPDTDAREDIEPDLLPGEHPFRAYLGVPLIAGDDLIGTLVLIHDESNSFGQDDLALVESLAPQAAIAIRKAQLYAEAERRSRELAMLNAVAAATNRALDLEALLTDAVDRVVDCVEADGGGIRLLDRATGQLTLSITQGISKAYSAKVQHLRLGEGVVGDVARTGEPALLADMTEDPRVPCKVLPALRDEGIRSFAVVPLRSREEVVGTLGVVSHTAGAFTSQDVRLLTAMGHQIGIAIANARLRQEAIEAERLAAVGRVAASLAHELRSPLGGIVRSAEFLGRHEISEATRRKLSSAIVAMARRLINMSQELLDYARGGDMTLHAVPCSLSGFLQDALEVLRLDFSDRGIAVETRWGYRGTVHLDPDRMAQVVYNIGANARDAMPDGGQFTVATDRREGWIELRFTDTGPGVPVAEQARIFEPFVSYGKEDGVGLGLAIAERIVHEHGGEIQVESPEGGGATLIVRLPLE